MYGFIDLVIRDVKLSLKFCSTAKRRQIQALLPRQEACVNRFLAHIWEHGGKLDKATFDSIQDARLSQRFKSLALNQALGIVSATRASARATGNVATTPTFRGACQLSSMVAQIQPAEGTEFSYWIKLSTLTKGSPIMIPLKSTKVLDKWLSFPGATLKPSCGMTKDHVYFYVNIPDLPAKTEGRALAIDVGLNKLLVDSDGKRYGEDFKTFTRRVGRRVSGSTGKGEARRARDNYINQVVNSLPWNDISVLVVEDLKNLKKGKKPNRSKTFRKALAPWTYAYVLERIAQKSQEHRVRLVKTSPSYTSQTCPACKHVARTNRVNEKFECIRCGFAADADHVGALNLLARFDKEPRVPCVCGPKSKDVGLSYKSNSHYKGT